MDQILYDAQFIVNDSFLEATYYSPEEGYSDLDTKLSGLYRMIGFFSILVLLMIFGMIVQYTKFGNVSEKKLIALN